LQQPSRLILAVFCGLACIFCAAAFGQTQAVEFDDGTVVGVQTRYNVQIGTGPAQAQSGIASEVTTGLAFYTSKYKSLNGRMLPYNIVGSDPSLGAATTVVPTVIVPIKFVFAVGLALDGTNVAAATQNSPIFQTADYTTGGTSVGLTQFGDALQRAEFWNLPGFSPAGYHVLLGAPAIAPTVTVTLTSNQGSLYRLRSGGLLGVVRQSVFDGLLATLYPSYPANTLPIFQTDNVYLASDGTISTCCILGYHASEGPPAATARTWIYAAYTEQGTFSNNVILDVQALSHETAEWLNDPFVGAFTPGFLNFVPPTVLPGQGGACIINFETGDPLEAPPVSFPITTLGTTYHLQDEVFLWWYLHGTSFAVNGDFTYLGTFKTPGTLCGAG